MEKVYKVLIDNGFNIEIVVFGSILIVEFEVVFKIIIVVRFGNYVYYDVIQIGLGCVIEDMCVFIVVCIVILKNSSGYYLIDCGSKCFGFDKGVYGNSSIVGYGRVCGYLEFIIDLFLEEVGKIKVNGEIDIKIGDRIRIIFNYFCFIVNLISNLLGFRGDIIEKVIEVDICENLK